MKKEIKTVTVSEKNYILKQSKFCVNESPVIISDNLTKKMNGVPAISTSVALNKICMERSKDKKSICYHCFANATVKRYSALGNNLATNTEILTTDILSLELLPIFGNVRFVRFEAFGDLNNEIQVINYFNICNVNPEITFTLWTKNPTFIKKAILQGYEKPGNLIIIFSSSCLNESVDLVTLKKIYPFIDKIFTVYDKKYIKANNININCGARSCAKCTKCYSKKDKTIYINEQLK